MTSSEDCIDFDALQPEPFFPYTAVEFKRRTYWDRRYVGNNLLWGQYACIDLRRGDTYMDWDDYLGPVPEDDFIF